MFSYFIDAQTWVGDDKYYNLNEEQIIKYALKKLYANYTIFWRIMKVNI